MITPIIRSEHAGSPYERIMRYSYVVVRLSDHRPVRVYETLADAESFASALTTPEAYAIYQTPIGH